jgi:DNA primase small subunit
MAKTPTLDARTLSWARAAFAAYYERTAVAPPERLVRRELAAFPFGEESTMRRHATVRTADELHGFLTRFVPRHVYYSSAYYRWPAEPTMAKKEWLGADLIFDLDSDHLKGADELDYAGQLDLVKRRLLRLVDDFLARDFGIGPSETDLVFSGGRGYHVHVRAERFLPLNSPERRELVDYVLGTGVDGMRAIRTIREGESVEAVDAATVGADGPTRARRPGRGTRTLVPPESAGWPGRTTRAVLDRLERWETEGRDAAEADLARYGVTPKHAKHWAQVLVEQGGAERVRRSLSLDGFPGQELPSGLLRALVDGASVEVQGETDAPVTTDIHRLIRLPGSLHGGTGFRVVPLDRDAIEHFDPFADALAAPEHPEPVPVRFTERVRYPFPGGGVRGEPGATDELAPPVALFLLLRQEAELPPSPT